MSVETPQGNSGAGRTRNVLGAAGPAGLLAAEFLAVSLCWLAAVWAYHRGVVWVAVPADPPAPVHLASRYVGGWIALAVLLGLAALLMLLDAGFRAGRLWQRTDGRG